MARPVLAANRWAGPRKARSVSIDLPGAVHAHILTAVLKNTLARAFQLPLSAVKVRKTAEIDINVYTAGVNDDGTEHVKAAADIEAKIWAYKYVGSVCRQLEALAPLSQ